jgi:hypothetical protein
MSTKLTISSNDDYHLYQEAFDRSMIYLQIDNCQELSVKENSYSGDQERQVTIGIPRALWRQVMKGSKNWVDNE